MRTFASLLLSTSAVLGALLLFTSSSASAADLPLDSLLYLLGSPKPTAPPGSPKYSITKHTWSNCNASLPVQLVHETRMMVQGDVLFALARYHTAVAIDSGYVVLNGAFTPASGGSSIAYSRAAGIESALLSPASLPIAAGTRDVLCGGHTVYRGQPGHFAEHSNLYDAHQNVIGCTREQYDVVQT